MSIAIFTCKHGRDQVNALFMENMRYLRACFDIEVFVATTHGETWQEDWIHSIKYANNPLGSKWNASVQLALNSKADRFMGMGDDDLISWASFQRIISIQEHHVGTKSVVFIEPYLKKAIRGLYADECNKLVGPGRTFTREAIERSSWSIQVKLLKDLHHGRTAYRRGQTIRLNLDQATYMDKRKIAQMLPNSKRFEFFGSTHNSGMDHSSDMNLLFANYLPVAVELENEIIDVKTEENIWSFEHRTRGNQGAPYDYEKAIKWMPSNMIEMLNQFKKK